jgi:hypothetical protein
MSENENVSNQVNRLEGSVVLLQGKVDGIDNILLEVRDRENLIAKWLKFFRANEIVGGNIQQLKDEFNNQANQLRQQMKACFEFSWTYSKFNGLEC